MKTYSLLISVLASLFIAVGCLGPRGYDGIDGVDGYDGTNGQNGKDGVANVGAAIYDVEPSSWVGDINGYTTTLIVPEINNYVFENGAVLVYVIQEEGSDYQRFSQLPYTWLNNSNTEYVDFSAFIGRIEITIRWVDEGINNTDAPAGLYTFKIIVIEGTPLSVLQANIDISNPEADRKSVV